MRVAVKNHALPVYKKNRIASLLCIFESTIRSRAQVKCFVIDHLTACMLFLFLFDLIFMPINNRSVKKKDGSSWVEPVLS